MKRTRRVAAARAPLTIIPKRPMPPEDLAVMAFEDDETSAFVPAPDVANWLREAFLDPGGPLANEEHEHLMQAEIGVLWTNFKNVRQMRITLGTAEIFEPKGNAWQRERQRLQVRQWFGQEPDFIITLNAPYCAASSDAAFCALTEHELYHCAQAVNPRTLEPSFSRETGLPLWAIRGHDVEEFIGVARRYGTAVPQIADFVKAVQSGPTIALADLAGSCGTCLRKVA
jgi:hypothetical protein